jgi:putative oxidoreductase
MTMLVRIGRLYDLFVRVVSSLQSPFLAVVRAYWGWQISRYGSIKLSDLADMTREFAALGVWVPGPTATFVGTFEFLSGILLAVGLFSRITALGLVIDMTAAYLLADRDAFFSLFSDPHKFSSAYPFIFFFIGLLILIFGPGKISIDSYRQSLFDRRDLPPVADSGNC